MKKFLIALALIVICSTSFADKYNYQAIKDDIDYYRQNDPHAVVVFLYSTDKEYLNAARPGDIIRFNDGLEVEIPDDNQGEAEKINQKIDKKELERKRTRFSYGY